MNLLITGGLGFIGSHVVELALLQDWVGKVVNVDSQTYAGLLGNVDLGAMAKLYGKDIQELSNRYVYQNLDVTDDRRTASLVRYHEITHCIHLAAETHVDRSILGPWAFMDTNVMGTASVSAACREYWQETPDAPHRFIQVSTDEVFGSIGVSGGPFTEESRYNPSSPYSASKAGADCLIMALMKTYGFPAMITYGCNTFGPRQNSEKLIPKVVECLKKREKIPIYGDGSQIREWLHVDDHATALIHLLIKGEPMERYCIGSANDWTNIQLVREICDIYDKLTDSEERSRGLISFVDDRPGHDQRYGVDATKLLSTGWRRAKEIRKALEETVRWYIRRKS